MRAPAIFLCAIKLIWPVQPCSRKYFVSPQTQNTFLIAPSRPTEGRSRSSRTRGGMRWTLLGTADERCRTRTAKSCGPDASTLASSFAGQPQSDGDNQARSPGRSRRKPLKPSRAGMPGTPALPVVTNSYAFLLCMRGCGCVGTRHSPRPSQVNGGKFLHNSGAFAPRERGHSRPPLRHRPRRRAIQYCRGADDQSTGRGVLDTRFRGYDDWAGLQKRPFANASAGECHSPVIAQRRSNSFRHRPRRRAIQYSEELMIIREAAAYWIPAFAGMTAGAYDKHRLFAHGSGDNSSLSSPNRYQATRGRSPPPKAQANVTRRVIAREGGRSSIAEELMINREAAAYWIPAFAGMTAGAYDKHRLFAHGSGAGVSSPAKAGDPVLQRS